MHTARRKCARDFSQSAVLQSYSRQPSFFIFRRKHGQSVVFSSKNDEVTSLDCKATSEMRRVYCQGPAGIWSIFFYWVVGEPRSDFRFVRQCNSVSFQRVFV